MLIYNVTVKLEHEIHEDWVNWMMKKHISDVLTTGCFISARVSLVQVDDTDGPTYSIQYSCESQEKLDQYFDNYASALREEHNARYGTKALPFRTILEVVADVFPR